MKTKNIDYQFSFRVETDLKEKSDIDGFEQTLHLGNYAVSLTEDEGQAFLNSLPEKIRTKIKAGIAHDYQKGKSRIEKPWEKTSYEKVNIKRPPEIGYIYLIKSQGFCKIGRAKRPDDRFKKYVTENPCEVELLFTYKTNNYINIETELLCKFKNKRIHGEWFDLSNSDIKEIERFLATSAKSETAPTN